MTKRNQRIDDPKPVSLQFACFRECGETFMTSFVPGANDIYHTCPKCGTLHHLTGVHDGYGQIGKFIHRAETAEKS